MWETWVRFLGGEDPLEREWLPTPVCLPGEFYGQRSLEGYSPWGRKGLGMTEQLTLSHFTSVSFEGCCNTIPRTGWFSATEMCSSTVWMLEVQGQGVSRWIPSEGCWGRICSTLLPWLLVACWQPLSFLGLQTHDTLVSSLSLGLQMAFSPCVCLC